MDKDFTKRVLKANDVRTARWINVSSVEEIDYDKIEEMGYPVFVKPTNGGSSVATFKIKSKEDIKAAVEEGLKWDTEVMIEEFVEGDEITCPVFDGKMWPVIAIKPKSDFFDYTQKYAADGADEIVIELEEELHKEVERMALETYKALKCKVYARVDMIINKKGVPYILEVNTLPGMTPASLFPKSASAKGISYSGLLDKIIETSLKVKRDILSNILVVK
jgi:D-alanine-D-alanine ligase